MTFSIPTGSRKKPIAHRLFALLLALGAAPAGAQVLTEQEALRIGLAQAGHTSIAEATLAGARADVADAGRWPNPVLEAQRETMRAAPTRLTERTVQLTQQLDLAGRRSLAREAARARLAASEADLAQRRLDLALEIRARFFEAVHRDALLAAARTWQARMQALADTVQALHKGGEAAGYDRRRIQLELSHARSRVQVEQAAVGKARERLRALLGAETLSGAPAGELVPAAPPPLDSLLAALARRPDLRALERRAQSHDIEQRAAGRAWIPEVTVGLGRKSVEDGAQRDSGTVLSLALPLPLFDRKQGEARRAAAQASIARSDARLQRARLEAELRGAWQEAAALAEAARSQRDDSAAQSRALTRIAEAAYRGGETGLLELLDAYRAELEAATRALELAWNARQAALELDTIAGTHPL
jgi:cobalt-zinc-cadmium efflux system outer membrane protein